METPPHSSLAHAYAHTESHPFPFSTPAMKASLYLNLQVHQNLKVHFFAVRASTTRLRCETYSTFFLFGPLTTLMVFTCFRCDVANYHRKVRRTGDGLQTKLARNHSPFFLASIDYFQPFIFGMILPCFLVKKKIYFIRGLRPFFRSKFSHLHLRM